MKGCKVDKTSREFRQKQFSNETKYFEFFWKAPKYSWQQKKNVQGITYLCTERIFACPQFVYNKIFLKKLLDALFWCQLYF